MNLLMLPLEAENPLLPAWIEMILAVVFVLLLTVVIARFVVPRFEATYAERTAAIQGGIEKAEQAQAAAQAALDQYNAQLAEARGAMMGTAWIGFAVTEALAIIGIALAFVFGFVGQ